MAVRTREEILETIRQRIGDATDDETLSFVEDITDTLNDYESRTGTAKEWEDKYNANDAEWRQRYRDRFFSPEVENESPVPDPEDPVDQEAPKTYADLFTEETEVK